MNPLFPLTKPELDAMPKWTATQAEKKRTLRRYHWRRYFALIKSEDSNLHALACQHRRQAEAIEVAR